MSTSSGKLWEIPSGKLREFECMMSKFVPARVIEEVLDKDNLEPLRGYLAYSPPAWYKMPAEQIEAVKVFLKNYAEGLEGFSEQDIPAPPFGVRLNTGEILMLAVYLPDQGDKPGYLVTLDAWWEFLIPPKGYTKSRYDCMISNPDNIRLLPGTEYKPGMRWIIMDCKSYYGESCYRAITLAVQEKRIMAGLEVVMAISLFPGWVGSWDGKSSPYPNAAGLQMFYDVWGIKDLPGPKDEALQRFCDGYECWSHSVIILRDDDLHELRLSAYSTGCADLKWASPSFREC